MSNRIDVSGRCLEALDIFILAGGLGRRIRPVLGDVPKILAPIGGRPYLAHLLDWLLRFGAKRVILGLGHRSDAVLAYMNAQPAGLIELVPVVEPSPLGTAGAIRHARDLLRSDPVLIMNGDSFTNADLCAFVRYHASANLIGSILCADVDDAGRYGRVDVDSCSRIQKFVEKDRTFRGSAPINAGIYLLSASLLDHIAAGAAISLEHDVFECLPPGSLGAFTGPFPFIDIGTPESLAAADGVFLSGAS